MLLSTLTLLNIIRSEVDYNETLSLIKVSYHVTLIPVASYSVSN